MTPPASIAHPSIVAGRHRTERAEAIKRAWRDGQFPDAAAALRENPDLAGDRAVALDLAYEEYCTREEAGEFLDPDAFCANFAFGASLHRLLAVHRFLDEHPDALGAAPAPAHWPAPGETVGDFLVFRELGRGSFARVYLALETTAGNRPVALKVSTGGSREAATLGPLAHPHLVPVLSSPTIGAWTVVAMPFLGTATLEDAMGLVWPAGRGAPRGAAALLDATAFGSRSDDPTFPFQPAAPLDARATYEDAVAAVAGGLFGAVAYLHGRDIAHRDIKPSNVLLAPGGHPYLLDFNLASHVTDPWRLVGTLPYLAPEQLARFTAPDPAASPDGRPGDVFACGVVLFGLLTGRHPFGATGPNALPTGPDRAAAALLAAQRAGHPDVGALNPKVRRVVRDAVRRCLALDPRERPTAAEMAELFARRARRRSWRAPAVVAGVGALTLALGATFLATATRAPAPLAQPDPLASGQRFLDQKQYRLAAAEFLAAATAANDGRAYGYAAYCTAAGQDPVGAVAVADEAIRLGNTTPSVYANRAYGHFMAGRYKQAKEDCDEALKLDPDLIPARLTRAVTALQAHLGKRPAGPIPPEAITDIDRVTATAPTDPDVWIAAAKLYLLAPDGHATRRDQAARYVHSAVRAGKVPGVIQRSAVFRPLAGHPVYENALTLAPTAPAPVSNPHLVAPLP